ncbi:HAD family hydrolase [Saccharopolyspora antimicrobica]|uniref:HAD superfamily hydrolase (TIGR01490 family) n=1 Tax=Saccharopolyspora antimicrobica TaxID=455193 RepID=A0ABX9TAE4_9PSEU|nr:HAD-IB family hydrolase [Saccharopolyspora antimicrobica]RKT83993.1 HAD superfamily hydrolase (TIGR01490 family) [Saccharopolyspora antimicrobica]
MLCGVTEPANPSPATGRRVAAFFDLDKTIIAKSSTLAFSRPFFQEGLINRRAVLKSAYAQFVFMLAGADADQMDRMRAHITSLCSGWDVEQVNAIVEETLHDIVDPLVYKEATQLITEHQEQGHDIVVLSASGEEVVAPISKLLGADHWSGTRMVVVDGRYTGDVDFYCSAENKAIAARELAEEHGYDLAECHAYSDSITDLPLLEAVGHPTVINPDRALRKEAVQRGWPSLAFDHPVSLRARIPTPSRAAVTAAGVGMGAVAAAGAAWWGLRAWRRRR